MAPPKVRAQALKAGMMIVSAALGAAVYNNFPTATGMPLESRPLYKVGAADSGVTIFISNVAPTIFGQDATDFDFRVVPETTSAIEAVIAFATANPTGNEDEMLVKFLNATMSGTITADQAGNVTWLCNELSRGQASTLTTCDGQVKTEPTNQLSKRGRWSWIRSAGHIASTASVNILYNALGNAAYANFPYSPRAWCNNANGANACISWSAVESFNHAYARTMVSDALSAVDFDHYSAQANKILSRKRGAADVCISNRASGCT